MSCFLLPQQNNIHSQVVSREHNIHSQVVSREELICPYKYERSLAI